MENIFRALNIDEVRTMSANKRSKVYRRGELIFREGEHAAGLFCLSSGKIKVFKTGEEGRDLIVRLARGGDTIGYRALISREPYYASAVALEESRVCFVPADEFFRYIGMNSDFSMELIQTLSRDLRQAEERILRLAQKTVRERLADALILLRDTYGFTPDDDKMLDVHLSREDFASLVGTATETVIRLISDFRSEGFIETPGKRVRLLDEKALRQLAGIHPTGKP
ncbi:MAG: Crp/Fnr family transcriptional regulator [Bacteroidetes bacterium]|nr:Crp/Fnr family transcriptional regulator [Bacteroidota bacterium]MCH8524554.1 Crp/Fnr family transcriptional regulator [Balneolales bacterium]